MALGGDPLSSDYDVNDVHDLIVLVTHLRTHLAAHEDEWENRTIDDYLAAIAAWLVSFPSSYVNNGQPVPNPDWRFVADLLRVGRIYE